MTKLLTGIFVWALAIIPIHAAQAASDKVEDFSITEAAKRMMPLEQWKASGQVLTVKEHEPIMAGGIAFRAVTLLQSSLTATIGGAQFTFDSKLPLFMAQEYSGADSASWGAATQVYCQMREINPRQIATGLDQKSRKSRFEKTGSLCLVDEGGDRTFDRAVLIGVKDRAFRTSSAIEPVSFTTVSDVPFSKSYVAILFHHQNALHTPRFYVQVFMQGKIVYLAGLSMNENPDTAKSPTPIALETSPGDLPKEISFGPSRFTVLSIDSSEKVAQVRIEADFGDVPVTITGSQ